MSKLSITFDGIPRSAINMTIVPTGSSSVVVSMVNQPLGSLSLPEKRQFYQPPVSLIPLDAFTYCNISQFNKCHCGFNIVNAMCSDGYFNKVCSRSMQPPSSCPY